MRRERLNLVNVFDPTDKDLEILKEGDLIQEYKLTVGKKDVPVKHKPQYPIIWSEGTPTRQHHRRGPNERDW